MKRLVRSSDRKLAGVCGGIADYFSVDATIIRLIFIVALIATAVAPVVIGYLIAMLIIPEESRVQ
ncbi:MULTISPECIES: PspC domain-containing protein [Fictibacillus]|uniref:PspC domain-containing protein n=1 Tax=Fictibacillus terranigra TaxID=3058424 RepID=A0ABT8E2J3_9BACL|nr:PspC domain-containing protein [Fictibacillus sp. CENA-BCM004]MDN4072115.1 PspC domain-containing protein [Fictibacillus sp. CENA-BCM004]